MNELFNLNADEAELMDIGKQVERMCLSASREEPCSPKESGRSLQNPFF